MVKRRERLNGGEMTVWTKERRKEGIRGRNGKEKREIRRRGRDDSMDQRKRNEKEGIKGKNDTEKRERFDTEGKMTGWTRGAKRGRKESTQREESI